LGGASSVQQGEKKKKRLMGEGAGVAREAP